MRYVCESNRCTGCGVCCEACPQGAVSIEKGIRAYAAVIDEHKCSRCGKCGRICQINSPLEAMKPFECYHGWTMDEILRKEGSSGGIASSISSAFIEKGGVAVSCTFTEGAFSFEVIRSKSDVQRFAGSKYVKSNAQIIYKPVLECLKQKIPVLFIGLPCQVAGLKKFITPALQEHLYTVDLVCHGTPSPELLGSFLKQYGVTVKEAKDISFREKRYYRVCPDSRMIVRQGTVDRYTLAFLFGLSYTDNCYCCQYARMERVSDLTLGDAWGSKFSQEERRKGISLLLCQTKKGKALIRLGKLHLENAKLEDAIAHNDQLRRPSKEPSSRGRFFAALEKGINFNQSVFVCMPRKCMRQYVKSLFLKFGII